MMRLGVSAPVFAVGVGAEICAALFVLPLLSVEGEDEGLAVAEAAPGTCIAPHLGCVPLTIFVCVASPVVELPLPLPLP